MRIRLAFGAVFLAVSALAIVGVAQACDLLGGSVSGVGGSANPAVAGPNDPVTYDISGMETGATYRVTFRGQTIAEGVSDGGGTNGSFSMPDLGNQPMTVYVELYSDHSDDPYPWDRYFPVQYTPPAPSQPADAPAPSHVSAPAKSSAPRVHVHRHGPPPPIAIAKHAAQRQRHESGTTGGTGAGAAPAEAVGSGPRPTRPSSGSGEAKKAGEEPSSVPHKELNLIGSTTKVGPADVPTIGLLLIAVIVIAGAALAAFVIHLLRRGPDPEAATKAPAPIDPDPVEAELQEIIADEMARQLLSDLELGEPTVTLR